VGLDRLSDGLVQRADGGAYALDQLDLDADELFDDRLAEAGGGFRGGAQALDQDAAGLLAGVPVALAPGFEASGCELGGGGRSGVAAANYAWRSAG
jgi:hypothetical protein